MQQGGEENVYEQWAKDGKGHTNEKDSYLKALFERGGEDYGPLECPTKFGLLALIGSGNEVWNAWISKYPNAHINLSTTHFESDKCDFSGFVFLCSGNQPSNIDFSNATFESPAEFRGCQFHAADFRDAIFYEKANFESACFLEKADFSGATFKGMANYRNCMIGKESSFIGASFLGESNFECSQLGDNTCYIGATFFLQASFSGAHFGNNVKFDCTIFREAADFSASMIEGDTINKKRFLSISFLGVDFYGDVSFRNREFQSTTDFGPVLDKRFLPPALKIESTWKYNQRTIRSNFAKLPDFRGCKFHPDTNFEYASFHTPPSAAATRAFRALKREMEQLKATREEQIFARLEMLAEHPRLHWGRRWISSLYRICSDYGISLWRPLATLFSISLLISGFHGVLADACASAPTCAASAKPGNSIERTSDLLKYTLASIAPVPGLGQR
jgi:uncharacterized protein YjbI with pentapeptide repeats